MNHGFFKTQLPEMWQVLHQGYVSSTAGTSQWSRRGHLLISRSWPTVSSRNRHSARCLQGWQAPVRRKSCLACASSKLRCGLERPACARCRSRGVQCEYTLAAGDHGEPQQPLQDEEQLPTPTTDDTNMETTKVIPDYDLSLQSASLSFSIPDDVVPKIHGRNGGTLPAARRSLSPTQRVDKHATELAKRILLSWVRVMADCDGTGQHLPPFIHRIQCDNGPTESLPETLSDCCRLAKSWANSQSEERSVVRGVITREVKMLAGHRDSYTRGDLLAASQSLVLLLTIILFGQATRKATDQLATIYVQDISDEEQSQLILKLWEMRECLVRSLNSSQQFEHYSNSLGSSTWRAWALSAATTRTILAMHTLELVWGTIRGYPIMSCFGLDKLPMPEAGYLWRARSEAEWTPLYAAWTRRWSGLLRSLSVAHAIHGAGGNGGGVDPYRVGEFLAIGSGDLDERAEIWLSEADEFAVMLMAGGNH